MNPYYIGYDVAANVHACQYQYVRWQGNGWVDTGSGGDNVVKVSWSRSLLGGPTFLRASAAEWLTKLLAKWGTTREWVVMKLYEDESLDMKPPVDLKALAEDMGFVRIDGKWALPSNHPLAR